ncbi:MAG TPA: RidA family protein [Steroidobacteraceae bacterium]|jgi:enamine deaminase RidA (YjgF/YER057c/UK114 family)|nr:RidA family protein [Steroidobacteraceae bacterium]
MSLSRALQPEGWLRPSGYSNGVLAQGRQVFIAGQIGWNPLSGQFESVALVDQVAQALRNVLAVLAQAEGRPEHIARMTWYLTSRAEYLTHLKEIGAAYRQVMGKHFPAMTAVEVTALVEAQAIVEIEATAVIP